MSRIHRLILPLVLVAGFASNVAARNGRPRVADLRFEDTSRFSFIVEGDVPVTIDVEGMSHAYGVRTYRVAIDGAYHQVHYFIDIATGEPVVALDALPTGLLAGGGVIGERAVREVEDLLRDAPQTQGLREDALALVARVVVGMVDLVTPDPPPQAPTDGVVVQVGGIGNDVVVITGGQGSQQGSAGSATGSNGASGSTGGTGGGGSGSSGGGSNGGSGGGTGGR